MLLAIITGQLETKLKNLFPIMYRTETEEEEEEKDDNIKQKYNVCH